jgi:hypothetical protein
MDDTSSLVAILNRSRYRRDSDVILVPDSQTEEPLTQASTKGVAEMLCQLRDDARSSSQGSDSTGSLVDFIDDTLSTDDGASTVSLTTSASTVPCSMPLTQKFEYASLATLFQSTQRNMSTASSESEPVRRGCKRKIGDNSHTRDESNQSDEVLRLLYNMRVQLERIEWRLDQLDKTVSL